VPTKYLYTAPTQSPRHLSGQENDLFTLDLSFNIQVPLQPVECHFDMSPARKKQKRGTAEGKMPTPDGWDEDICAVATRSTFDPVFA
jgi:hypothetical protein